MKVGMGIITMGVRTLSPNIERNTARDTLVHVEIDRERRGVAVSRNACLRALSDAGCDYIFLFDDDCYPVMSGWEEYFLTQHALSGMHFMGLPEAFKSTLLVVAGEMAYWENLVGCFSFQTSRFLDRVGGYNTAYQRYGYEDVGRHSRARRSGLCGQVPRGLPSPVRAMAYIHSEDVFGEAPAPNMTQEEKDRYIALNHPRCVEEVQSPQLYYPI
jgi:hypothetical protein